MRIINDGVTDKVFTINGLPYRKGLYEVYYNTEADASTTVGIRDIYSKITLESPIKVSHYNVNGATFIDSNVFGLVSALSVALGFNLGGGGSVDIKTINSVSLLGTGNILWKNEAGQVKVNYTGLSLLNFTAEVSKTFNIAGATSTVVASPVTTYPYSTPNSYSGIFDSARGTTPVAGRLIENPINGQAHIWRVQGTYANKAAANNGSLDLILRNPVSGFTVVKGITLPSNRTSGAFDELMVTVADGNSVPSPNGYILESRVSFTDANLAIEITSITRLSNAKEPF
jgi:hypothetical protein